MYILFINSFCHYFLFSQLNKKLLKLTIAESNFGNMLYIKTYYLIKIHFNASISVFCRKLFQIRTINSIELLKH